jgi:murein DD-endopeptidase MepM/ murein hydrolase activator NlpD
MRIYLIGKNTKKTKSLSVRSLFILFTFIVLGLLVIVNRYVESRIDTFITKLDESLDHKALDENPPSLAQDAYIRQISELSKRLDYIDLQTERIQKIMQDKIIGKDKFPEIKQEKKHAAGGPFINDQLNNDDVILALNNLIAKVEERELQYNKLESMMLKQSVLNKTLPSLYPVDVPYRSSSYGWRHDPILGIRAFHNGLDFSATQGEPIMATASGRVKAVGHGQDYGKYIVIDHGDELETRYAHASKIFVKVGDIVERKDIIAEVGNTGRSTGPHLHYEIRYKNHALDPRQYLKK